MPDDLAHDSVRPQMSRRAFLGLALAAGTAGSGYTIYAVGSWMDYVDRL